MVSFWPRPRKTVLTGTFLFPLKLEFLVTKYEVILPCLQFPFFFFGAQGVCSSLEMAWMQIIFAVSC